MLREVEAVLAHEMSHDEEWRYGATMTLLQGVTGSGKTLVYIRLAQELLREGKSVMILVPEIALTPQMMARFTAYFGAEVALLHSGLRLTERYDQYKRIRRGEAHIVLGTRSAVFAPLRELGLIVLDEEQESSYESGSAPFYHARDIAKYRCAQEGARLLLGSATPTVETAYFARHGEYELLRLDRRFNAHRLPRVVVADLREELRALSEADVQYEHVWEHKREERDKQFKVVPLGGGVFRVEGPQVERMVVQTDWENEEAIAFLQHRLKRLGVEKALEKAGAVDGDEIRIVGRAFEFESVRTAEDLFKELDL